MNQITVVLREFEKLNPEWRLVGRALRNELALLPRDRDVEDFSRLITEWEAMFGIDSDLDGIGIDGDDDVDGASSERSEGQLGLEEMLRRAGLRLRDRLN